MCSVTLPLPAPGGRFTVFKRAKKFYKIKKKIKKKTISRFTANISQA